MCCVLMNNAVKYLKFILFQRCLMVKVDHNHHMMTIYCYLQPFYFCSVLWFNFFLNILSFAFTNVISSNAYSAIFLDIDIFTISIQMICKMTALMKNVYFFVCILYIVPLILFLINFRLSLQIYCMFICQMRHWWT